MQFLESTKQDGDVEAGSEDEDSEDEESGSEDESTLEPPRHLDPLLDGDTAAQTRASASPPPDIHCSDGHLPPTSSDLSEAAEVTSGDGQDDGASNDPDEDIAPTRSSGSKPTTLSTNPAVKDRVTEEITKRNAQQTRKHHSKKAIGSAGRAKGSKAKQDTRVRRSDWD